MPEIVGIEWIDTVTRPGWAKNIPEMVCAPCYTVGFIAHQDKRFMMIAGTLSLEGQFADITTIPQGAIIAQHKLEAKSAQKENVRKRAK